MAIAKFKAPWVRFFGTENPTHIYLLNKLIPISRSKEFFSLNRLKESSQEIFLVIKTNPFLDESGFHKDIIRTSEKVKVKGQRGGENSSNVKMAHKACQEVPHSSHLTLEIASQKLITSFFVFLPNLDYLANYFL